MTFSAVAFDLIELDKVELDATSFLSVGFSSDPGDSRIQENIHLKARCQLLKRFSLQESYSNPLF